MSDCKTTVLHVGVSPNAREIACLTQAGTVQGAPSLVWISGFNSTMVGTKASDLSAWAANRGLAMTRFDYSGHGQSSGQFVDGTISDWLEETHTVIAELTEGPQILIGSSMGGWIALHVAQTLNAAKPGRIAGLVLIAPAWDMTERLMWQPAGDDIRKALETDGVWHRPSRYGDEDYPITMRLIEDGRAHLFGDGAIDTGCPARILHGLADPDVPWEGSVTLNNQLVTDDVHLLLVGDAGHRLSRPGDIRLLKEMIAGLANTAP